MGKSLTGEKEKALKALLKLTGGGALFGQQGVGEKGSTCGGG